MLKKHKRLTKKELKKDPLLIYKFESFELFKTIIDKLNKDIVSSLLKGFIPLRDPGEIQEGRAPRRLDLSRLEQTKQEDVSAYDGRAQAGEEGDQSGGPPQQQQRQMQPVRTGKKIGRNDMVKVRYKNGKVVEAKYKKVEVDIINGNCTLTS